MISLEILVAYFLVKMIKLNSFLLFYCLVFLLQNVSVVICEEDEPPVVPDELYGNKDQQSKYNVYDEVSKLNLQTHIKIFYKLNCTLHT